MKTRLTAFVAVIGLITLSALAACAGLISNDETIRYKMTVTIETPEGERVGSAVKEAVRHTEKSILPEQGGTFYVLAVGQAVIIDLNPRGLLFASQTGEREASIAFKKLSSTAENDVVVLDPLEYPLFVIFKDLNDPKSVEMAKGFFHCENQNTKCGLGFVFDRYHTLENVFGKGIGIKSVTIQRTNDPVMFNIETYLKWLRTIKGGNLIGKNVATSAALYERLGSDSFLASE